MELKIDLTQTGFEMFFRDYQVEILKVLWNSDGELASKEVWEKVSSKLESGRISRASVINSLNAFVEMGILDGEPEPCKGGYRMLYTSPLNEEEVWAFLSKMVHDKLTEFQTSIPVN
ncbi:MAG: hypothetical protein NWE89_17500 [Candidatus Bathyarchaeota archaeon]|nr:hypothetical protein [Candidatus Bathyarchaeota archaeon]